MRYLVFLLLASCASVPSMPSVPTAPVATAPKTVVGAAIADTTNTAWSWVLMSCLLVFIFPSMREPIRFFLSLLFKFVGLPMEHCIRLYNQKFKDGKEEEF